MENNDQIDIAALAHQSNLWLNHKQIRDASRIDPRRFLQQNPGMPPQYPQQFQQPPYYPPNPYQPQPNFTGGVDEYGIPSNVPVNNVQIPLIAHDKDGNPIDLMQAPSVAGQIHAQSYPSPINQGMTDVRGFQIPDYSKYNTPNFSSNNKEEISESTLDIILREIKSLKKSINKLIRESERSKLLITQPPTTLDNNEVNDQSSILSERIRLPNSGD